MVIREEGDVKVLDRRMKDLQKELVKRVNHGEDYSDLSEKIRKLQEEREGDRGSGAGRGEGEEDTGSNGVFDLA